MTVGNNYGVETSTAYQRQQAEKEASSSGKVSHVDFLKLLTTQLTNQDPLNPMEDIDFTGQLAQLQALDEQMEMTKAMKAMRLDTQLQAGSNMIGKFVSGVDTLNQPVQGLVSRVSQDVNGVYVELAGGQKVEIGNVTNVWNDATGMIQDIGNASNAIGMWVDAGVDKDGKAIKGIVEKVSIGEDGQLYLKMYGGSVITWDQINELRYPSDFEATYWTLEDSVRERAFKALEMTNMGITGTDVEGNEVSGIVAGVDTDGKNVYLILYTGEIVELGDIEGEPREPTAEDAAKSLDGLYVKGLNEDSDYVEGIVVGAEQDEKGLAVILDDGSRVYFDSIKDIREADKKDQARLHGMFAQGIDTDGNKVQGLIVEKLLVDDELAVKLDTGEVILCKNLLLVADPDDIDLSDLGDGDEDGGDELAQGGDGDGSGSSEEEAAA